jgi:hypothetical protein
MKYLKKFNESRSVDVKPFKSPERYINSILLTEGELVDNIKAFASSNIPKVKDASEEAVNNAKASIAKAYGFTVEQWNDPENKAKVKSLYEKLKEVMEKIKNAGWSILSDPKKLSTLLTTLNLGAVVSIVKGVWDLIFASSIDISFWHSPSVTIGGIFYFKLALFLFAIKVVLGIIGGAISFGKIINGMVGFIKDLIGLFTNKNQKTNEPVTNTNQPMQESLMKLFEMYGYESFI